MELPSELAELKKIEELFLSKNCIEKLPSSINKIKSLEEIELTGNPLIFPPYEIAQQGIAAIRNYFYELESEDETDFLNEIKLILVGEGRVGKTTISKRLTDPEYKFKHENSTEGVNINTWNIPKLELNSNTDYKLNVWDFGGQEIYHSTHQFFLTKRSIYLLITESRKEDKHEDFYYWLNTIQILGDKSPVILVLNKCDQPSKDIPFKDYKQMFPNLIDYVKVGCKSREGHTIDYLKGQLKNLLLDKKLLPHIGNPLPKVWVDIRKEISKIASTGINYISLSHYLDICLKYKMAEDRALFLSDFFHDIGVFLHFKDDIRLRDTVFLNHEYVTKGVYNVLDNEKVIASGGEFSDSDLLKIWQGKSYENKRPELLALMMNNKFELCFKVNGNKYLAPQLLPTEKHEFNFPAFSNIIHFEIQYKFMPKGLLTRFIVKRSEDIYKAKYWRYGVILKYNDSFAQIEEHYFDRKIVVQVSGSDSKLLLELIRKTFDEIHANFKNLEIQERIPCNCSECLESDVPHFYNYNVLQKYLYKRKTHITCEISLEDIPVKTIIDNVMQNKTKIFISYSHSDRVWLDRLNIHLKPLKRNGLVESWDDTQIKAGDKWMKEIENKLESCNVAILLISADFLASDFIVNNELPPLLQKAEYNGLKVIPVILKPSLFLKNPNLSCFQAINSPNEPIISLPESKQEEKLMEVASLISEMQGR